MALSTDEQGRGDDSLSVFRPKGEAERPQPAPGLAAGKVVGDFKLLAALGAWLGWKMILPVVLGASVIGAIVGEWIGSTRGIGALIIQATYSFDSALLYSAVIMSSFLAGAFFLLITLIERMVVKWQPTVAH